MSCPATDLNATAKPNFCSTAGNLYSGESQLSLGDHTSKTAWYASATGSRANYGLETPISAIHHDATNSESAFASLLRNQTSHDQLRLDAQFRNDFFQIPYDPDANDWEQASNYYNSSGLRDTQTRARLVRNSQLGSHSLLQVSIRSRPLLSLQPGQLRFTCLRLSRRDHLASIVQLHRRAS